MKQLFIILPLIVTSFFVLCKSPESNKVIIAKAKHPVSAPSLVNKPVVIDIVPYSDVSSGLANYIFKEFTKIYPTARLLAPISLPHSAYYSLRARYRADTLIRLLSVKTPLGHVTLALTTKDISCTHDGYADWGIMGYSYLPGKACVASIFRLKNNKEQLFKVAIHELGHTQGLDHCPVKTCFMRDAKGKNHTNEEKEFCPECKKVLIKAGWVL